MARLGRVQPFKPRIIRPDLGRVYFDNQSNSPYEAALSTYNWTHVVGTNNNRALFVGVSIFATGTVTSITLGSQGLVFIRADVNGVYRTELWQLTSPVSGSGTITVNLSVALTSIAGAASYWNVDQRIPYCANNGNNGTNNPASASVTPVDNNVRVFGVLSAATTSGTSDQIGQVPRWDNNGALGTSRGAEKGTILTPASTTIQWNGIGTTDAWAASLVSIRPPRRRRRGHIS